ncbi:MAG: hypothetical protein U1C59_05885, partial [Methylotenera sp.]|nr:hypothetical protein [Methylotenera sp.]
MHIFLNTQCLKQIILIIAGCAVLVGCTAPIIPEYAGIKSITGEPVNDVLYTFKKGEARLTCESDGCLKALNTIPHMTLCSNWEWNELVFGVAKSGYSSNLTYYYFGRAAEGFGYDSAAATYYQLGLGNVPQAWVEGKSKDHATSFIQERLNEMEYRLSKQAEDEKKQAELASIALAENKRIEEAEADRKREEEEQKAKAEERELAEREKLAAFEKLLDSAQQNYLTTLKLKNKTYYQKKNTIYNNIISTLDWAVIVNVKEFAKIGDISSDCKIKKEKYLSEMTSDILLIGVENCPFRSFYKIVYKGKEYGINVSDVEPSVFRTGPSYSDEINNDSL